MKRGLDSCNRSYRIFRVFEVRIVECLYWKSMARMGGLRRTDERAEKSSYNVVTFLSPSCCILLVYFHSLLPPRPRPPAPLRSRVDRSPPFPSLFSQLNIFSFLPLRLFFTILFAFPSVEENQEPAGCELYKKGTQVSLK